MAPSPQQLPPTVIPRRVRVAPSPNEARKEALPRPISDFREQSAWVLLGEPGSGKSTVFLDEADQAQTRYMTVADFLDLKPDPSWASDTLFLDGMDEAQAVAGREVIRELRRRLSELGNPRFRIACRAWDWNDSTDRNDLGCLSPEGLEVIVLEPLNPEEIRQIMTDNHAIEDPEAFVSEVKVGGLEGWLTTRLRRTLRLLPITWPQWVIGGAFLVPFFIVLYTHVLRPARAICWVMNGQGVEATVTVNGATQRILPGACVRINVRGWQDQNALLSSTGLAQSFGPGVHLVNLADRPRMLIHFVTYWPKDLARYAHLPQIPATSGLGKGIHLVDGDPEAHVYGPDDSAPGSRNAKDEHPTFEIRFFGQ